MLPAPARYQGLNTNPDLVYDAVCKTLSDRTDQVDWAAFDPDAWDLFSKMALMENVAPLIYWKFKDDRWPPNIPPETAAGLMGQYYQTHKANTLRFAELDRIIAAFNAAGIPLILLKGAHLARTLYPDIGLRPMGDLDVLVPRPEIDKALTLVNSLGYDEYIPEMIAGMNQEIGHHHHLKNEKGIILELHWSLVAGDQDWRKPPDDLINAHLETVHPNQDSDTTALVLNPLANLLYLSAHIALQHGTAVSSLLWLYDIHYLIQTAGSQINWKTLTAKAFELGWTAALNTTLNITLERFNTSLPPTIVNELHNPDIQGAALVHSKSTQATPLDRALNALSPLDKTTKIKVILAHLFPSPTLIRYHYNPHPSWLWPLYYPYRLFEIAWKILSSLPNRLLT